MKAWKKNRAATPAAALCLVGFAFAASWSLSKETANPIKIINIVADESINITRRGNRPREQR